MRFTFESKFDTGDTVYLTQIHRLGQYEVISRTIREVEISNGGEFRYKLNGANSKAPTSNLFANSSYKEDALFLTEEEAQAEADRRKVAYVERTRERLRKEIAEKRTAMNDTVERIRADYQEEIYDLESELRKVK